MSLALIFYFSREAKIYGYSKMGYGPKKTESQVKISILFLCKLLFLGFLLYNGKIH